MASSKILESFIYSLQNDHTIDFIMANLRGKTGSDVVSKIVGDVESKYAEELKSDKIRRQRGF